MNPYTYDHFIFDKAAKTIQLKKDSILNKWFWFHRWSACRKMHPYLLVQSSNPSGSSTSHIKPHTLKITEETVGKSLQYMSTGGKFLNRTPVTYTLPSRIDKNGPHNIAKLL